METLIDNIPGIVEGLAVDINRNESDISIRVQPGVAIGADRRAIRVFPFMGTFALAAVLTPPDIITQVLLAVPLYGLYEFGVVVSMFFEDPKAREKVRRDIEDQMAAKQAAKNAAHEAKEKKQTRKKVVRKVVRKVKRE